MDGRGTEEITRLLIAAEDGDPDALDRVVPRLYDEMRDLARVLLRRESPGHTLQATALVHEAWERLSGQNSLGVTGRRSFFRVAGTVMRRILVDHARKRRATKRGEGAQTESLDATVIGMERNAGDLIDLEHGLEALAARHPRQAQLIEQRFFLGLEVREAAEVLGISLRQAERDWTMARSWLRARLSAGDASEAHGMEGGVEA